MRYIYIYLYIYACTRGRDKRHVVRGTKWVAISMSIIIWVITVGGGKYLQILALWFELQKECPDLMTQTTATQWHKTGDFQHDSLVLPCLSGLVAYCIDTWFRFCSLIMTPRYFSGVFPCFPHVFTETAIVCGRRQGCQRHSAHLWLHVWWRERSSAPFFCGALGGSLRLTHRVHLERMTTNINQHLIGIYVYIYIYVYVCMYVMYCTVM